MFTFTFKCGHKEDKKVRKGDEKSLQKMLFGSIDCSACRSVDDADKAS
jgi:hypothetical protein